MLAGLPTCKNNWTQVRFANPAWRQMGQVG
jgi:hypothetical protein